MTDNEIRELFDSNLNMTVAQLARIANRSVDDVKKILLGEPKHG